MRTNSRHLQASGHVRKRGSKWSYVISVSDPTTGDRKHRWKGGYSTKRIANRAMHEALAAHQHGTLLEPSEATYGDYITKVWLPQIVDQKEHSTVESYARNMRVHVIPRIGGVKLRELTPSHLNQLYRDLGSQAIATPQHGNRQHPPLVYERIAQLRAKGAAYQSIADALAKEFPDHRPLTRHSVARIVARSNEKPAERGSLAIKTVRYIHSTISGSLKDAIKLGLIHTNPASNASPPKEPKGKKEKQLWTAEETRRFLQWAQDIEHPLWTAWAFITTSGDRRGKNLGLRWSDIDFEESTAQLVWNVISVDHEIVVNGYGKGGRSHEIVLDSGTLVMLKSWRARQNERRLAIGESHVCESNDYGCPLHGYHQRDLVFCRPNGEYLHPDRFYREFKRAQARYNRDHSDTPLPDVTIHALRHGWATAALEAGVALKVVQDRLDHASERITADIYTHVRAPMQSDAAERVAALLLPKANRITPANRSLPRPRTLGASPRSKCRPSHRI